MPKENPLINGITDIAGIPIAQSPNENVIIRNRRSDIRESINDFKNVRSFFLIIDVFIISSSCDDKRLSLFLTAKAPIIRPHIKTETSSTRRHDSFNDSIKSLILLLTEILLYLIFSSLFTFYIDSGNTCYGCRNNT